MNKLPPGWAAAKLWEIAVLVMGQSPPSNTYNTSKDGLPFFQGKAEFGNLYPRPVKYCSHPVKIAKANDVLISVRAPVGPTNINAQDSCIGRGLAAIRPLYRIPNLLILYYLRSIEDWLAGQGTGSTFTQISKAYLENIDIPLPPLNEQRRIVAQLDILLSRLDAAKARLATIPRIFKRFRQSVLAVACSGKLTADWRVENSQVERATTTIENLKAIAGRAKLRRAVPENVQKSDLVADWELPQTWGTYSTAELLRCGALVDLKDGNHGANHPKVSEFTKKGVPFITAAQVSNYRIDYDGAYKLSGEPLARIHVGFAKSGDVVYTHKGSVGRVAVADRDCVLTPQTTYYRVNPDVFSNRFVMFYLASHAFSEQVNVVKEQTTRDFVPISEQYLLFQRVPPLAEQQEIVRRVEALFKTADALESRYRKAKANVDNLTQSILAKAFRGELIPQDPNDEPASVLLEKIRKTPERTNKTKHNRKGKNRGITYGSDGRKAKQSR